MNRRDFFKLAAAGSTALVLETQLIGQIFAQSPDAFLPAGRSREAHTLARLTFGVNPEFYEQIHKIGVEAFIEAQLNPESIDDSAVDAMVQQQFPLLAKSSAELIADKKGMRAKLVQELVGMTVARMVYSKRGLNEMMVDFWTNHFNVYTGKGQTIFLTPARDRDAIRPYAMTNFRDLLHASAKNPAVLFYLDNSSSTAKAPNENFARELMELHTLGVDGGYNETDVKEVARAFTGWSIIAPRDDNPDHIGEFIFRQKQHDRKPKQILGQTLDAGDITDGEAVLDMLAAHPSSAKHVSTKLVRKFVSDAPQDALVARVAQTFLDSGGDIRSMLRVIFTSDEFWNATPRLKRPLEYLAGSLRAMDYQPGRNNAWRRELRNALETLGQVPFNWPAPNGYPDASAYWLQNMLPRWNTAIMAATSTRAGSPDYDRLAQMAAAQGVDMLAFLADYLFGRPLTDNEIAVIEGAFGANAGRDSAALESVVAVMMASPAFQTR